MPQLKENINIFIAYSRKDKAYLERLRTYLKPLERKEKLKIWYDGEIIAGNEWEQDIKLHIHTADIIILLISADALASEYFFEKELPDALKRHHAGESVVTPIILRPCDFETSEFVDLQLLPTDGKPLTKWNNEDEAYTDVVRGLRKTITKIKKDRYAIEKKRLAEINDLVYRIETKKKQLAELERDIINSERKLKEQFSDLKKEIKILQESKLEKKKEVERIQKEKQRHRQILDELVSEIEYKRKYLSKIESKQKQQLRKEETPKTTAEKRSPVKLKTEKKRGRLLWFLAPLTLILGGYLFYEMIIKDVLGFPTGTSEHVESPIFDTPSKEDVKKLSLTLDERKYINDAIDYLTKIRQPKRRNMRLSENEKKLFPNGKNIVKPYKTSELQNHINNINPIISQLSNSNDNRDTKEQIQKIAEGLVSHKDNYYPLGFKRSDYRYILIREEESNIYDSLFNLAQAKNIPWKLLVEFNQSNIRMLGDSDYNGNPRVKLEWQTPNRNDGEILIAYIPR